EFSEEFTLGLITVLINNQWNPNNYKVKFMGTDLPPYNFPELIPDNEMDVGQLYNYTVDIGFHYGFNTPDFMQGVKTAAEWLDLNPNDLISNFKEVATETPLQIQ